MTISTTPVKKLLDILKKAGILLFWLFVWQIAAVTVGREVLLPSPIQTIGRLASLACTLEFWQTAALSIVRIMLGFAIGVFIGVLIGWVSFASGFLNDLFAPILTVVRATPVASFIILALVWVGSANVPSFAAFLMVLPVVWGGMKTAFGSVDKSLVEVADVYGASTFQKIKYLYIPETFDSFLSLSVTSMGLAWKAGVAAEVLAATAKSIGRQIYESKMYLETVNLFAWTTALILISLALEWLFMWALRMIRGEHVIHLKSDDAKPVLF